MTPDKQIPYPYVTTKQLASLLYRRWCTKCGQPKGLKGSQRTPFVCAACVGLGFGK